MSQIQEIFSPRSRSQLIDELMDRYVEWREQCAALSDAYAQWSRGSRSERRLAFEAYKAALDLEEHASQVYADRVRRFERTRASRQRRAPSAAELHRREQPAAGWA